MAQQNADETQKGGGNVVGKAPSGTLYQPPSFLGKSGQSDNANTNAKQVGDVKGTA
jgi:hypothetical protein